MRAICHILRIIGYITLLPYLAYANKESFATCMRDPGASALGLSLALLTFLCIIGYGNILHRRRRGSTLFFWMSNTVFYALAASLVLFQSGGRIVAGAVDAVVRFAESFFPHFQPNTALFAVAGLTEVFLAVWMPVAVILSLIASIMTFREHSDQSDAVINTKKTEPQNPKDVAGQQSARLESKDE